MISYPLVFFSLSKISSKIRQKIVRLIQANVWMLLRWMNVRLAFARATQPNHAFWLVDAVGLMKPDETDKTRRSSEWSNNFGIVRENLNLTYLHLILLVFNHFMWFLGFRFDLSKSGVRGPPEWVKLTHPF